MQNTLVVLSGGLDSTVLLHHLCDLAERDGRGEIRAISVNYGQRHARELEWARWQCDLLDVPLMVVDLSVLREVLPGSSQTDSNVPVPEGHYAEESMKATVVPNRNMILLAVAVGHAIAYKLDAVAYGAHAGDHAIYPDCRPEFASAMQDAVALCDWRPISLLRPFISRTKAEIVGLGHGLGVDYRFTWSCYKGGEMHCGRCGTCVERREAFELSGVEDPTHYAP